MQETKGTGTNDQYSLKRLRLGRFMGVNNTGQRLEQRSFLEGKVIRFKKHIVRDDMIGNEQVVGVGAHHHTIHGLSTEIFLAAMTKETITAGRGRGSHNRIAGLEALDAIADFFNHAGKLVPERRRQTPHRMAPMKGFQIGSAAQRAYDFDQDLARAWMRGSEGPQLEAAGFEQHRLPPVE